MITPIPQSTSNHHDSIYFKSSPLMILSFDLCWEHEFVRSGGTPWPLCGPWFGKSSPPGLTQWKGMEGDCIDEKCQTCVLKGKGIICLDWCSDWLYSFGFELQLSEHQVSLTVNVDLGWWLLTDHQSFGTGQLTTNQNLETVPTGFVCFFLLRRHINQSELSDGTIRMVSPVRWFSSRCIMI